MVDSQQIGMYPMGGGLRRPILVFLVLFLRSVLAVGQPTFLQFSNPGVAEVGAAVAIMPNGNIVVGGSHGNLASVAMFDGAGNPLWARTLAAATGTRQYVQHLVITPDGFIVGCGNTEGGGGYRRDGFIFKMSSTGNLIWHHREDHVREVFFDKVAVVDANTYVVACGYVFIGSYTVDALVARIDAATGTITALSPRLDVGGISHLDDPAGIVAGSNGNIYVTGRLVLSNGAMRPYLVRLNSSLNFLGCSYYLGTSGSSIGRHYPIQMIESSGGLVTATFGDRFGVSTSYTTGLYKTDMAGNLLWAKDYDIPGSTQELSWAMAENSVGYQIVGRTSTQRIYVLQTDFNGDHLWTRSLDAGSGVGAHVEAFGMSTAYTAAGIVFTGRSTAATPTMLLGRMSLQGSLGCHPTATEVPTLANHVTGGGVPATVSTAESLPLVNMTGSGAVAFTYPNPCASLGGFSLGPDPNLCTGPVQVNATVAGATQYQWNTGATTAQITIAVPGTYAVTVTVGCCLVVDSVNAFNAPPILNLGPDLQLCAGGAAVLDAGSGLAGYTWNTGATSQTITVSQAGTYVVTVTNGGGCTAVDTLLVQVSNPSVDLGADTTLCSGQSVLLDAGGGFAGYAWSTGGTTQVITVSQAGAYVVTVTDGVGCSAVDTLLVQVSNPFVDLGADTTLCGSQSTVLDAGGGFVGYAWSTGGSTQTITVSQAGNYVVTVTDVIGCTAMDTILVQVGNPSVDLGADTILCPSESVVLDASNVGSSYAWNTGATSQTVTVATSGVYVVTVTDPLGCMVTDSLSVLASVLSVNLGPDTNLCAVPLLTLDAGPGQIGYVWNTGDTTQQVLVSGGGVYVVSVIDSLGCLAQDSVFISEDSISINLGPDTLLCVNDTAYLDAGWPNQSHLWSTGDTGRVLMVTVPGTYWVLVTTGLGCTGTDTVTYTLAQPTPIDLGQDQTYCGEDGVTLQSPIQGLSYLWSTGGTLDHVYVDSTGTYELTVETNCGPVSDAVRITLVKEANLFIPNVFTPNGDGIGDRFVIEAEVMEGYHLDVFDRWGHKLFVSTSVGDTWDGMVSGNAVTEGVYYYVLRLIGCDHRLYNKAGHVTVVR